MSKSSSGRVIEFILALVVLVFLLLITPLVALAIKLNCHYPIFYRAKRVGKDGKIFTMFKFCTFPPGTEEKTATDLIEEEYNQGVVTKVGKFLRRSKIDELPQVINVLKGEMALVGPRPARPEHYELCLSSIPGYAHQTKVKQGITGLAQVYGGYQTHPKDKLRYNLLYIRRQSILLDLKLMLLTLVTLLFGRGWRQKIRVLNRQIGQKISKIKDKR